MARLSSTLSWVLLLVLVSVLLTEPAAAGSAIRLVPCSDGTCVVVSLPPPLAEALAGERIAEEDWQRVLPVRTKEAADADPAGPTIFGSYDVEGAELVFRPRLPLLPGTQYRAAVDLEGLQRLAGARGAGTVVDLDVEPELTFELPRAASRAPRVVAIRPESARVPGNLLRAYVEFSVPMRPDVVFDYLHLVDDAGEKVPLPFVEINGGLWDPRGNRLTLLFHPGRLKRGVAPREQMGPPLEAGRTYRLQIDPGWPAVTGEPLVDGASRSWAVGADDSEPVVPGTWDLGTPRTGSKEVVRVRFGEPLDHALALRLITVVRAGEPVAGTAELSAEDTVWTFRPALPWSPDEYAVRVHAALEDLAGNNMRGAFDRESGEVEAASVEIDLPFSPRR